MISDNGICTLFERHAKISINTIFAQRLVTSIQFQNLNVPLMNSSSGGHG